MKQLTSFPVEMYEDIMDFEPEAIKMATEELHEMLQAEADHATSMKQSQNYLIQFLISFRKLIILTNYIR